MILYLRTKSMDGNTIAPLRLIFEDIGAKEVIIIILIIIITINNVIVAAKSMKMIDKRLFCHNAKSYILLPGRQWKHPTVRILHI